MNPHKHAIAYRFFVWTTQIHYSVPIFIWTTQVRFFVWTTQVRFSVPIFLYEPHKYAIAYRIFVITVVMITLLFQFPISEKRGSIHVCWVSHWINALYTTPDPTKKNCQNLVHFWTGNEILFGHQSERSTFIRESSRCQMSSITV